ncbi:MAG: class I tRNA ligase family protein, partial [Sediminispirochaetaceae bacterium]
DQYGADSLKFTLAFLAAQGQDILLAEEDFRFGSKFANKIWNATRFLLMNLEGRTLRDRDSILLKDIDRWIFHRLNEAVKRVGKAIETYRFNDAAQAVYEYFWSDFCDWYIEASKLDLYSDDDAVKDRAISLLMYILEESMRLLHPFLPFLTEEIYQKLPSNIRHPHLITAPYPEPNSERENRRVEENFNALQDIIRSIRTIRSEFTIPPEKKVRAVVCMDTDFSAGEYIRESYDLIFSLIGGEDLRLLEEKPDTTGAVPAAGKGYEAFVYISDLIDVDKEKAKLEKEKLSLQKLLGGTEKKLQNRGFLDNAPEEVVEKEREKLKEFQERTAKVEYYLSELGK